MDDQDKMQALLLSYVGLLAERHGYGPEENFEYRLWDDLARGAGHGALVSDEEAAELITLAVRTACWVTYDVERGMFGLIDLETWKQVLVKRGH
jgi:hypothetical protein